MLNKTFKVKQLDWSKLTPKALDPKTKGYMPNKYIKPYKERKEI